MVTMMCTLDLNLKMFISTYHLKDSNLLKKQLTRLFAKLAPWIKLNYIFYASNNIAKLSKLKSVYQLLNVAI